MSIKLVHIIDTDGHEIFVPMSSILGVMKDQDKYKVEISTYKDFDIHLDKDGGEKLMSDWRTWLEVQDPVQLKILDQAARVDEFIHAQSQMSSELSNRVNTTMMETLESVRNSVNAMAETQAFVLKGACDNSTELKKIMEKDHGTLRRAVDTMTEIAGKYSAIMKPLE